METHILIPLGYLALCLIIYIVSLFVIFDADKQEKYWKISKHSFVISVLVMVFYFVVNVEMRGGENFSTSGIIILLGFSMLKEASRNLLKNLLRICKKNPRGVFTLLDETINEIGEKEYWGVVEINGKKFKAQVAVGTFEINVPQEVIIFVKLTPEYTLDYIIVFECRE